MNKKSPVSTLEEYSNKNCNGNIAKPIYSFSGSMTDTLFHCSVNFCNKIVNGVGNCKKVAKQDAAENMLKYLEEINYEYESESNIKIYQTPPSNDCTVKLRKLCKELHLEVPKFEVIEEPSTLESSKFTQQFKAICVSGTVKSFGISSQKKAAKQIAAQQLIDSIEQDNKQDNQNIDTTIKLQSNKTKNKMQFETYREYVGTVDNKNNIASSICNRHEFYKNLEEKLKLEAIEILDDPLIDNDYDRVEKFLNKLNIKFNVFPMETIFEESFLCIEVLCELECFFAKPENELWGFMVNYFRDMLK